MNDFERELRDRMRAAPLPSAPASLSDRLASVVLSPRDQRRRSRRGFAVVAVAAVLAAGGIAITATGGLRDRQTPPPVPTTVVLADASASPDPTSSPTSTWDPTFPTEVEGLSVITVSELQGERAAGRLSGGPIALAGFWSYTGIMHSCALPRGNPGDLEIYCHDGEYGITERNEQSAIITRAGRLIQATGPMITPYIREPSADLFLAPVNGQPYPPVPIVVIGHLDDPMAADCRPEARTICLDRFVFDRIVMFDPTSVPLPTPTPPPTPLPFDSPPPTPLDVAMCIVDADVPAPVFSFVGWIAGSELALTSQRKFADETLYVAIARDPVPLGGWSGPEADGRRWRTMGRLVCLAHEWDVGAGAEFDSIAGSVYREYDDGSTAKPEGR